MYPYFARYGISRSQWSVLRALHRSAASGVAGLRLYVERINDGARKTYQSLGMEISHYDMMEKMWG